MSTTNAPAGREFDRPNNQTGAMNRVGVADHGRRLSTETKAAFKTTEFIPYLVVLAGILIAGAVSKAGG